jgi:hypothetical protein
VSVPHLCGHVGDRRVRCARGQPVADPRRGRRLPLVGYGDGFRGACPPRWPRSRGETRKQLRYCELRGRGGYGHLLRRHLWSICVAVGASEAASALLGSALAHQAASGTVPTGAVKPIEKVRTSARALSRLEELALRAVAAAEGRGRYRRPSPRLAHPGQPSWPTGCGRGCRLTATVVLVELGAVVGAHVGPGTIAVAISPRPSAARVDHARIMAFVVVAVCPRVLRRSGQARRPSSPRLAPRICAKVSGNPGATNVGRVLGSAMGRRRRGARRPQGDWSATLLALVAG